MRAKFNHAISDQKPTDRKIASSIAASENDIVYDLHGHYLMPGVIDDQVHFREPGLTHKGH